MPTLWLAVFGARNHAVCGRSLEPETAVNERPFLENNEPDTSFASFADHWALSTPFCAKSLARL